MKDNGGEPHKVGLVGEAQRGESVRSRPPKMWQKQLPLEQLLKVAGAW